MAKPEAVIFDLYETLITNFSADYIPPTRTIAQRLGINEAAYHKSWLDIMPLRMTGVIKTTDEAMQIICQKHGINPPQAEIGAISTERLQYKTCLFHSIESGIIQLLDTLKRNSVKLGLISNVSYEECYGWYGSPLSTYFDCHAFSCELGIAKPSRLIYNYVAEKLSVNPNSCLYIGDGSDHELTSAHSLGFTPMWARWFIKQWPFQYHTDDAIIDAMQFERLEKPQDLLLRLNL